MAYFEWKEEYSVNIKHIDEQHKIFAMCNFTVFLSDTYTDLWIYCNENKNVKSLVNRFRGYSLV
ncbi:MAG: hypothetical protein SCARUB_01759 [Candidatus Scalindua rubra]|uniref:Uncharacterized protein n=1 Tax=Candidatus Scalindua rubra TaxID=1872076 RepID=A0A1E3XBX7_9BACT|nr:MAG: hypothetical protein SCARUB_01759 [Candidatus Scalindua rubra]